MERYHFRSFLGVFTPVDDLKPFLKLPLNILLYTVGGRRQTRSIAKSDPSTSDSSLITPEAPTLKQRKKRADDNKENDATKRVDLFYRAFFILSYLLQPTEVDPTDTFGKHVAQTLKGMLFQGRELCRDF